MYLIDKKGRKLLDGVASMWCNVWGHSKPELIRILKNQSKKLQHSSMFNLTNEPAENLAKKLVKISPGMHRVFFSDNGSTAMEISFKIALQYWANLGKKNKTKIVEKQNVLIFLSPTIVKPRTHQGINPYSRMKLDMAKEATDAATQTGRGRDPVHDWFFDPKRRGYSYKVDDFATARYQPVTADIRNDQYYRTQTKQEAQKRDEKDETLFKALEPAQKRAT